MHSFVIPPFILISVSITRLTLRTRHTCMSFGCHLISRTDFRGIGSSFAMTGRDGPFRAMTVSQHLVPRASFS